MNTHLLSCRFILFIFVLQTTIVPAQSTLPEPDHIVIVMLENHSYGQIIGSKAAPYINSLSKDTASALFIQSYGIYHPSQPNYLVIFSGNNQGVVNDSIPAGIPFNSINLGWQLMDSGKTFITYSEDLPSVGYNGESFGKYARRHNPAVNWMGNGNNQIPPTTIQSFSAFPKTNFAQLPTVCFVQPSTLNDMHDGIDPERITRGDNWISTNMDNYIQWAKVHNSLFILTFDEDDNSLQNHITTIFTGEMVLGGQYSTKINHYSLLHTVQKMVGLPLIGDSTMYEPITYCWKSISTLPVDNASNGLIYPNPCSGFLYVELTDYRGVNAEIYNLKGMLMQVSPLVSKTTEIKTVGLSPGLYVLKIQHKGGIIRSKFIEK